MIHRSKSQFEIESYGIKWRDAHSKEVIFSGGAVNSFTPDVLDTDIYFGHTIYVSAIRCGVDE